MLYSCKQFVFTASLTTIDGFLLVISILTAFPQSNSPFYRMSIMVGGEESLDQWISSLEVSNASRCVSLASSHFQTLVKLTEEWECDPKWSQELFPATITFSYTKTSKGFIEGHGIVNRMEIRAKVVQRTAVGQLKLIGSHRAEEELREVRSLGKNWQ